MVLFAPIIADTDDGTITNIANNYKENDENLFKNKNLKLEEKNNELIISYEYKKKNILKKDIIKIPNPKIYNKDTINKNINKIIILNKLKEINFMNSIKLEYFQDHNFYTYNEKYKNFNEGLLKYILHSNTIRSLFENLYSNKKYIFEEENIINQLINSIIFVPYTLYKSFGCTFKKHLIIFINGLINSYSGPISFLSKSSSFQILGLHEGCSHWASGYYYYFYQDSSLIESIKFDEEFFINLGIIKKNEDENNVAIKKYLEGDGGDVLEIILFSKSLKSFKLKEILCILCRNSYNDDFKDFRKKFQELEKKPLIDLYNQVNKDIELNKMLKFLKIDLNYLKELEIKNSSGFQFKRNGDLVSNSRCGELKF